MRERYGLERFPADDASHIRDDGGRRRVLRLDDEEGGHPADRAGLLSEAALRQLHLRSGRRTPDRYRSRWYSKKGGKLSVELTHTRGTMVLEFYTEDDRVLQRWEPGDPLAFTVELPPKTEVWWRADMNHFSGSICFR